MTEASNPLIAAVENGNLEATQKLVELGANINRRYEDSNVALKAARNAENEKLSRYCWTQG